MCMQDLAISRNTVWRKVSNSRAVTIGGVPCLTLPPSPIRIMAFAANPPAGVSEAIQWSPDGNAAMFLPNTMSGAGSGFLASSLTMPGVFDLELIANNTSGTVEWWEAVPNTGLDHAVTGMALAIMGGRANE